MRENGGIGYKVQSISKKQERGKNTGSRNKNKGSGIEVQGSRNQVEGT